MKRLQIKHLGILLGIFILINTGCKPFESLTIQEPKSFKIQSATLNKMSLSIKLPIHNPNFYPIKVKKLQAIAYINENAVGQITNEETLKIPAHSNKIHDVTIDVDYSEIFDSGFSLMKVIRSKTLQLVLDGKITVKSFLLKRDVKFRRSKALEIN